MEISDNLRKRVSAKFGGRCAYCGKKYAVSDIHVSWSEGGTASHADEKDFDRLMPVCWTCWMAKAGKSSEEFRQYLQNDVLQSLKGEMPYNLAVNYGLVKEIPSEIQFYYERAGECTPKGIAAKLDGREYLNELTDDIRSAAEGAGLVIVYGYSDDCIEFAGAIDDERDCFKGRCFYLDPEEKKVYGVSDINGMDKSMSCAPIIARWYGNYIEDDSGFTQKLPWSYETIVPHETFVIKEDGEPFCRGIVFSLDDAKDMIKKREEEDND